MTPAPMTPSRFGTASNSRAFHESTMNFPSCGAAAKRIGVEPDANTTCFACRVFCEPSGAVTCTLLPGKQPAVALDAHRAGGLQE